MSVDKLVIDRKLWGTNALLNEDGTMCCLGHLSAACGVPKDKLLHSTRTLSYPSYDWVDRYGLNKWAADHWPAVPAAEINDSDLSDSEKETKLIKLFRDNGVELSFIGSKHP